ncbi:hypothetical protein [Acidovorax sp. SUPP2825]|uniref:DUF7210 family protein n=1 Tax=Acidovorax sp. SUPP2825 TaxID=2920879 RepID=UPI0023DE231C|nr:hypothetical protein [Acidovorax sp. SUPP2825]GKS96946.1 hypothetical protein AVAK2825_20445 [Acidovorax sp. SUPP2825]
MPKYTALTPIKHDGKRFGVGSTLTLKAEDAAGLLAMGAVESDRTDADAKAKADADAKAKAEADAKAKAEADAKAKAEADAKAKAEADAKANPGDKG